MGSQLWQLKTTINNNYCILYKVLLITFEEISKQQDIDIEARDECY